MKRREDTKVPRLFSHYKIKEPKIKSNGLKQNLKEGEKKMKVIEFLVTEIKKAVAWNGRLAVSLAWWVFGIVLRLSFMGAFLFVAGGGCFILKSYLAGVDKKAPDKQVMSGARQSVETGYRQSPEPMSYQQKSENIEDQLRDGGSRIRSGDYTIRSVKRDIEDWFKRR